MDFKRLAKSAGLFILWFISFNTWMYFIATNITVAMISVFVALSCMAIFIVYWYLEEKEFNEHE